MKIEISEEGVIYCDGTICKPLDLYYTSDECGSCPVIALCQKFLNNLCDFLY